MTLEDENILSMKKDLMKFESDFKNEKKDFEKIKKTENKKLSEKKKDVEELKSKVELKHRELDDILVVSNSVDLEHEKLVVNKLNMENMKKELNEAIEKIKVEENNNMKKVNDLKEGDEKLTREINEFCVLEKKMNEDLLNMENEKKELEHLFENIFSERNKLHEQNRQRRMSIHEPQIYTKFAGSDIEKKN